MRSFLRKGQRKEQRPELHEEIIDQMREVEHEALIETRDEVDTELKLMQQIFETRTYSIIDEEIDAHRALWRLKRRCYTVVAREKKFRRYRNWLATCTLSCAGVAEVITEFLEPLDVYSFALAVGASGEQWLFLLPRVKSTFEMLYLYIFTEATCQGAMDDLDATVAVDALHVTMHMCTETNCAALRKMPVRLKNLVMCQ